MTKRSAEVFLMWNGAKMTIVDDDDPVGIGVPYFIMGLLTTEFAIVDGGCNVAWMRRSFYNKYVRDIVESGSYHG